MTGGSAGGRACGAIHQRRVCADYAQKHKRKPWPHTQWVIPPQANAACVCAMEDVLEVYTRPYDPQRPQVRVDETSKQLVAETRTPIPATPGQPQRVDDEYERRGTANLFMIFEPLAGKRHVKVAASPALAIALPGSYVDSLGLPRLHRRPRR